MKLVEIIQKHIIKTLSEFASFRDLRESYIPPVDGKIRQRPWPRPLSQIYTYIYGYQNTTNDEPKHTTN